MDCGGKYGRLPARSADEPEPAIARSPPSARSPLSRPRGFDFMAGAWWPHEHYGAPDDTGRRTDKVGAVADIFTGLWRDRHTAALRHRDDGARRSSTLALLDVQVAVLCQPLELSHDGCFTSETRQRSPQHRPLSDLRYIRRLLHSCCRQRQPVWTLLRNGGMSGTRRQRTVRE